MSFGDLGELVLKIFNLLILAFDDLVQALSD
jgi:hypothetical protein